MTRAKSSGPWESPATCSNATKSWRSTASELPASEPTRTAAISACQSGSRTSVDSSRAGARRHRLLDEVLQQSREFRRDLQVRRVANAMPDLQARAPGVLGPRCEQLL